jgi:hypothetical protein
MFVALITASHDHGGRIGFAPFHVHLIVSDCFDDQLQSALRVAIV